MWTGVVILKCEFPAYLPCKLHFFLNCSGLEDDDSNILQQRFLQASEILKAIRLSETSSSHWVYVGNACLMNANIYIYLDHTEDFRRRS